MLLYERRAPVLLLARVNAFLPVVRPEYKLIPLIPFLFLHKVHQLHEVNCGLVALFASEALLLLFGTQRNRGLVFTTNQSCETHILFEHDRITERVEVSF